MNLTLYIRYDSSSLGNENSVFQNGELLAANIDIVSGLKIVRLYQVVNHLLVQYPLTQHLPVHHFLYQRVFIL